MFTIDTNILIAYLSGDVSVVNIIQQWRSDNIPLLISSITECEIFSYSKMTATEEKHIEVFLRENFIAFPFDGTIARKAAIIRRNVTSLKLPDAAIAAFAKNMNSTLVTRNIHNLKFK